MVQIRSCIVYRRLDVIKIREAYLIPRMDDCIAFLGGATISWTPDCNSGYWQVPIALEECDKTAFIVDDGMFCFTRIPFGLNNAPGTVQRAADTLLAGDKWKFAPVYLDDFMVYSCSVADHYTHGCDVPQMQHRAGLALRLPKCSFFHESVA